MDNWQSKLNGDLLPWLLEPENPSVRYLALRDLLDRDENNRDVLAAKAAILQSAPVKKIIAAQKTEGYWAKAGVGYSPKYKATDWQILFLAELGADGTNHLVQRGCEYLLTHAQATRGGFSAMANAVPSGAIHCLNGNLIWALVTLGYYDDRVRAAVDWLAGAITGDDFDAFNATVPGPGFKRRMVQVRFSTFVHVRRSRSAAGVDRSQAGQRSASQERGGARALKARRTGTLGDEAQSQRQDVGRYRRERQAEQVGDASRAARVGNHLLVIQDKQ